MVHTVQSPKVEICLKTGLMKLNQLIKEGEKLDVWPMVLIAAHILDTTQESEYVTAQIKRRCQ